jgi:type I restriction enzyme S subunit
MTSSQLKPGWKMVKFGEVVKNANLVERDPEANDIERIVGLEHIDPENLHIRRWNFVADGTSFTRKFVPGQTLFGKRRAYQRKVAYAEFEGICSGDILTFEPKNREVLLPELLPFICQSDAFFDYALGTSAGSLSPRTSWTALKDFEFPLPPLDEQKRIAEILWAADEAVEKYKSASNAITNVFEATKKAHFGREHNTHFRDVLRLASGKSKTKKQQFDFSSENPVPVYGGNGITGYTSEVLVDGPVVVVGRVGEYCGAVHLSDENCWVTDNAIYVKGHSPGIETSYLYYALIYANLNSQKRIAGQPLINQEIIESSTLYLPSIDEQREVLSRLSEIKQQKQEIEAHISKTALMLKSLGGSFTQIGAAHV